jgi:hypothetical protein
MPKITTLVFVLVLISFLAIFGAANAQTSTSSQASAPSLIALSANQLNFYGQEGAGNISRTINIVGLVNATTDVTIIPADLYNNNTGTSIPYNNVQIAPSNFTLSYNELQIVTIWLKTAGTGIGTYQGTILVTAATDALNVTVSNISITAKIDICNPVLVTWLFIIGILVLFGVTLIIGSIVSPAVETRQAMLRAKRAKDKESTPSSVELSPEELKSKALISRISNELDSAKLSPVELSYAKLYSSNLNTPKRRDHVSFWWKHKFSPKYWAIISGLIAVFLWLYLNTGPGMSFTDTNSIFSTVLMVPLVGYLIGLFTSKAGKTQATPKDQTKRPSQKT